MKIPATLIIMDGFAIAPDAAGNAIAAANTPTLDKIFKSCPRALLEACGEAVGLPAGTVGNSEVGHTNIGAGRVVYQSLLRISNAVDDGTYFKNPAYLEAIDAAVGGEKAVHILILLSDAGVHSSLKHLWAALRLCRERGAERVYLHLFTDGRDTSPTAGAEYLRLCAEKCAETGARIATVMGRFYGMDRDKRWDRVETAYDALVSGEGLPVFPDPAARAEESYKSGVTDEFIEPFLVVPEARIRPGDTVLHLNFRPDRARELTRALVDPDFNEFSRPGGLPGVRYVCAAQYDESMPRVAVAFPPHIPPVTLGEYLSKLGMTQLRIAETEKYAHVTFFFNGGVEKEFPGESRILIPSPRDCATYDEKPEMSANEVCDRLCEAITGGEFDAVIVNFANCDMVGHTGNFEAAVKAVETVDACVGRALEAAASVGGTVLVTADHGNADRMLEPDGSKCTSHTMNRVPFVVVGASVKLRDGRLCDIAPTMLDLMGIRQPCEMTGESLIVK